MSLACTITPNSINLLLAGRMRTVDRTHPNFLTILETVKEYQRAQNDDFRADAISALQELVDIPSFISRVTEGKVQVGDDAVYYDGKKVHSVVADRILAQYRDGFDIRPLVRFMDKVALNPNEGTREDLYEWLERSGMPLTEDGDFLAFKKVRDDYKSYHDIETDNSIGAKPTCPDADTSRNATCSRGLHFCSYAYLPEYYGNKGRVVIVKINPKDVAAIPSDYGLAKGRAYTYEVIGEVPEDEAAKFFTKPVVEEFGTYSAKEKVPFTSAEIEFAGELPQSLDFDLLFALQKIIDAGRAPAVRQRYLAEGFHWASTKQGHVYWSHVYTEFYKHDLPISARRTIEYWIALLEGKEIEDIGDPAKDWQWSGPEHDPVPATGEPTTIAIPTCADDAPVPDKFVHSSGRMFTAYELKKTVEKHGQRGASCVLGIPRSTLQGWLKRLCN